MPKTEFYAIRGHALNIVSGEPATEFQIFSYGENLTSKGVFLLDHADAVAVVDGFRKHGQDRMPIDYDHGMLGAAGPTSSAAAGWFIPEVRASGLWAADVQWTDRALTALRAREFRFLSPAFNAKDNRITKLINVALTNLPATRDALPLVAKQQTKEAPSAKGWNTMSESLFKVLGAKDESEALVIATEINNLTVQLLNATGTKSLSDAMAAVEANAEMPAKVAELTTQLDDLAQAKKDSERAALIVELSKDGKLPPALHDWANTQSIESLSQFGAGAVAVANTAAPSTSDGAAVTLSDEDREIIAATGISKDDFVAERKLQLAKKGNK